MCVLQTLWNIKENSNINFIILKILNCILLCVQYFLQVKKKNVQFFELY